MSLSQILTSPATIAFLRERILKPDLPRIGEPAVPPCGFHPGTLATAFETAMLLELGDRRRAAGLRPLEGGLLASRKGLGVAQSWGQQLGDPTFATWIAEDFGEACKRVRAHRIEGEEYGYGHGSVMLAKLANLWRTRGLPRLDHRETLRALYERTPIEVCEELVRLRELVPWDELLRYERAIAHPEFGEGAGLVGGADGDLLLDDMVLDVKCGKAASVGIAEIRQVVCYALLCNAYGVAGLDDPPEIHDVGIYLARTGELVVIPLEACVHPGTEAEILDFLVGARA